MKQSGTHWIDPLGERVPVKYINEVDKLSEKNVSLIAEKAQRLSELMDREKAEMLKLITELRPLLAPDQRTMAAYSFDHEYKVHIDFQTNLIYVFRAKCKNPQGPADFERILLEFSKIGRTPELPLTAEPQEDDTEVMPVPRGAGEDYPVIPQNGIAAEATTETHSLLLHIPEEELHPGNREAVPVFDTEVLEKRREQIVKEMREDAGDPDLDVQIQLNETDGPKDDTEEDLDSQQSLNLK